MNKPIRIVYCANTFETISNGPAKFSNILFNYASQNPDKLELFVITADVNENRANENSRIFKLNRSNSFWYRNMFAFIRMFSYKNKILKLDKQHQFDLVIFSSVISGFLYTFLKPKAKKTWGFINDDKFLNIENKLNQVWYSYIKQLLFRQIEKKAANRLDLVISNSKFISNLISIQYGINPVKIYCLYKAVDLENSSLTISEKSNNIIHVLFVKSDFIRGGLNVLVSALNILKDYNFKLDIIGPDSSNKQLQRIINNADPSIDTNIHGLQPQASVFKFMDSAHIFCVPSYFEALGVANMEALARGVSVVSTNVGGVPEVLDNGRCGWLVNPGDELALSAALKECIENNEVRMEKSEFGRQFVLKRFNKERMLNEIQDLFDSNVE